MGDPLDEVDSIMQELGLSSDGNKSKSMSNSTTTNVDNNNDVKNDIDENDVDQLMKEIGVGSNNTPQKTTSSGPGRGISSGPGSQWARGRSSGPGPGRGRSRGFATETPDGRPIIHSGPPCATCGEMIVGQCMNAVGKTFHPECFVCSKCNQKFPNGAFVEHDGKAYCEPHYTELFCPKCFTCNQPVVDKCVNAGTKMFHPNHFTCTGCGKNLVGQKFSIEEDDIFCMTCKTKNATRKVAPG